MVTKLEFLAKNETMNYTPDPIRLLEMKIHSDTREDKIWCPVRALKYYVDRTKNLRGDDQLFIQLRRPHIGVQPSTFAGWIVKTIRAAYGPGKTPDGVHAHDVRGVSASWAKFNNTRIEDVIRAAAWKTPSTFISCYVKDIVQAEHNYGIKVVSAAAASAKRR